MARPIFFPKSPYPHYYPCSENSNPKVIVEKQVFTALFSTEKTFPNSEVDKLIFLNNELEVKHPLEQEKFPPPNFENPKGSKEHQTSDIRLEQYRS